MRETNVERINEQLAARGDDLITAFTHDAVRLANGYTIVLGYVERILTDQQGPGPVDVLGDMIIVLDRDFQVTWTWKRIDHLDPEHGERPRERPSTGVIGCPLLKLAKTANDWTHSNTIAYSPNDGNLLVSMRNQDWVVKVDYRDGAGTGNVVWRLGHKLAIHHAFHRPLPLVRPSARCPLRGCTNHRLRQWQRPLRWPRREVS